MHAHSAVYNKNGAALESYDIVSLFSRRKLVRGEKAFVFEYMGLNWFFSNETNRETFKASPEKFLPEFGGYCAYGLANGYKAPARMDTFTFYKGKLYFNFSPYIKDFWKGQMLVMIPHAEKNWPKIHDKPVVKAIRPLVYLKYKTYTLIGRKYFSIGGSVV